jgi:hypothetical protein
MLQMHDIMHATVFGSLPVTKSCEKRSCVTQRMQLSKPAYGVGVGDIVSVETYRAP